MRTHRGFVRSMAAVATLTAGTLSAHSSHEAPRQKAEDDSVEVGDAKAKLRAFTDGKNHYVVLVPFDYSSSMFFYGSGADFYQQRPLGGGKVGEEAFNRSFWDPRQSTTLAAEFRLRDHKYKLTCEKREIEFKPLPDAESQKIITGAHFHRPMWKHQSYWLARDEHGNYFYVDRLRDPPGNTAFRLWFGPKGALKPIKMTNIVSDSKGDVFSMKGGELRLVSNQSDGKWIKGHTTENLKVVPIEDNHVLVYSDLGVYSGEKLGTPCDDL